MARNVEVANLDLAADPPTATINVCSGGSARGTDENGQPKSFNEDPKIVVYEAEFLSNQVAGAGVR